MKTILLIISLFSLISCGKSGSSSSGPKLDPLLAGDDAWVASYSDGGDAVVDVIAVVGSSAHWIRTVNGVQDFSQGFKLKALTSTSFRATGGGMVYEWTYSVNNTQLDLCDLSGCTTFTR